MNQLAKAIVDISMGEAPADPDPDEGKNPAAVALGRLGGAKGGKARAKKLSKARRIEIAANAAQARWGRIASAKKASASHGKAKKADKHGR